MVEAKPNLNSKKGLRRSLFNTTQHVCAPSPHLFAKFTLNQEKGNYIHNRKLLCFVVNTTQKEK